MLCCSHTLLCNVQTDENLQKMLYPYLPEPMRNPETFKWMLSNPEYRQQLETMMEQQVGGIGLKGRSTSSVCTRSEVAAFGLLPLPSKRYAAAVLGCSRAATLR